MAHVSFLVAVAVALVSAPPPSLERAASLHGPAVVSVHGKDGSPGPGFFVSSSGVAVAVVPSRDDVVLELGSGERRRARVLVRDEDGLALVELVRMDKDAGLPFPALALASPPRTPVAGEWLLGLDVREGRAAPSVGGLRRIEGARWRLDLPLAAGAPVLVGGRVIGVVLERAGTTSCVAVPVGRVADLVRRIPSP